MDFSNIDRLDHSILLGIINEKLRLECDSFDDLVTTYEFNSQAVLNKLGHLGYQYDPLTNQFKAEH
ncbi:DUF4250 domain-containing protein [Vibrio rhizosphaerae]|uniref:DUF4250 domain-containing protein n=1 Tax=Vibrio rhizosphaerae TaxID=398736 RepID=A0ABU4IWV6_9VIBR|nr:DUF4250 domain-containing protein [Vibrio rhizosphaerae]MDW6092764.1 DUF4250 domain-containing protein [Vibrio rhizosphaerae]